MSIQQDQIKSTVPAVTADRSKDAKAPSDRRVPIWALALMYPVFIGLAIVFGIVFFGSH